MAMQNENELVVGLDIGGNSVGWAVVEMSGDRLKTIHGMGSRIIPMGPELKDFQQGNSITKNAIRRQKRSMRRNNQRYKLRRAKLLKVLEEIGAVPTLPGAMPLNGAAALTSIQLYGLRSRAVDEPVTLPELGRVLYHMSQRRGYKDIGELMDELNAATTSEEEPFTTRSMRTSTERSV